MKLKLMLWLVISTLVACTQSHKGKLPLDPKVRFGKLENGLTYYIRHNNLPENCADFYLVQKVGSMQEEENQSGLAHFLEHMAFNGTGNFPDKTILNYLEKNGIKFGEDINAYTSYDETVYNINNVPTHRQGMVDSCLLILHDWSNSIALHDEEIDKERGVIEEEWRQSSGSQQRIIEQLLPALLKGSRYANRLPIGSMDIVQHFKYDELRDYYKKWYRPDLQGIIIVGNVDPDKVESKIKELFAHIKLDENRAERVYYTVPDNDEPLVSIITDKEASGTNVTIYFKHDPIKPEIELTEQRIAEEYMKSVAISLFNERLFQIVQQPDAPFISAEVADTDYIVAKTKYALSLSADCSEDKIGEALTTLVNENQRIKQFGFTDAEYERARTDMLQAYQDAYQNRNRAYNGDYVKEYVAHFSANVPAPGIKKEYEVVKAIAARTSVEDVNNEFRKLSGEKNIAISVTGPELPELEKITPEYLVAQLQTALNETSEAYEENISEKQLIEIPPTPGSIVNEEKNEAMDASVWRLSNGMKIILKQTDFEHDEIVMSGAAVGGFSRYAQQDPINSSMITTVMTLDGVGDLNLLELDKALSGKAVGVSPSIEIITQSFSGGSSVDDFESMLQLIYLYFTAPRTNEDAFNRYIQHMRARMKNMDANPETVFDDSVTFALHGNNPLFDRLKAEDIKKIDYQRIQQMYKECFANPGNFIFSFVGNIDKEKMKPAILQYLGSLQGREENPDFVKLPLHLRTGKYKSIFKQKMQTPKATIHNTFSGKMKRTQKNQTILAFLTQILDIVYTEKVREDEGGTYGVSTSGSIARYPEEETILSIQYDTDPAKVEKLNQIIARELQEIAKNGPRETDFNKVKSFMSKNIVEGTKNNSYWNGILNTLYFYGEDMHTHYPEILHSITPADVKEFTAKLLDQKNETMVIMMPK